jgi:hypothetical protein
MTITDEVRANHIITQSSGERAITLLAATLNPDSSENDIANAVNLFPTVLKAIKDAVLDSIEETAVSGAVAGVSAAFPGTTAVTAPATQQAAIAAAGQTYQAAPSVPAAIPGATGGRDEDLWQDLVRNSGNWFDNRLDPKKPANAPDFRHKTLEAPPNKMGKVYKVGLYADKAPVWAKQALGIA